MKKKTEAGIGKRYFTLYEPIFRRRVHVLLNNSAKDFEKWAHRMGDTTFKADSDEADFQAISRSITNSETGVTEWIIQLRKFEWAVSHQASLIHEIVHTIMKIWNSNNIPHTIDTQEFLAHSIGNLYEEIAAKILRLRRLRVGGL